MYGTAVIFFRDFCSKKWSGAFVQGPAEGMTETEILQESALRRLPDSGSILPPF